MASSRRPCASWQKWAVPRRSNRASRLASAYPLCRVSPLPMNYALAVCVQWPLTVSPCSAVFTSSAIVGGRYRLCVRRSSVFCTVLILCRCCLRIRRRMANRSAAHGNDPRQFGGGLGHISVIVPTFNEQEHLPATLSRVALAPGDELIVVDGGSSDQTVTIACQFTPH